MAEPQHMLHYLEELRSKDPLRQIKALSKIERLNKDPVSAIPDILPLLASEDASIREKSAQVLGLIAPVNDENVCSALLPLLNDADDDTRNTACSSLGLLRCQEAREVIQVMALQDPDWMLRSTAVLALGEYHDATLLPTFLKALYDEHVIVRADAASAIRQLALPQVQPLIEAIAYATEANPIVRINLLLLLDQLGDTTAFSRICDMIDAMEPDISYRVLHPILNLIGEPQMTKEVALQLLPVLDRLLQRTKESPESSLLIEEQLITSLQHAIQEYLQTP